MNDEEIRVVVGVDFGTTYSGFAYAHVANPRDIFTNITWPTTPGASETGRLKANTILHYDANSKKVLRWGRGAVTKPKRRGPEVKVAELFKLWFAQEDKSLLSCGITAEAAIKDYLKQMNELIKTTLLESWSTLIYPQNVRFVFTVPAEYDEKLRSNMRRLVYEAGFLENKHSANLQFTTEPEAAALYCFTKAKEHSLSTRDCYLIVDCGGGTVDLTVRQILGKDKIGEMTERTGDFCGGTYVDREFDNYLEKELNRTAVEKLKRLHYHEYQHLVDAFCNVVKNPFSGDKRKFEIQGLELNELAPSITKYLSESEKERHEENDWLLEPNFGSVKAMFDPVINRIIELIRRQLQSTRSERVKAIFLVGGFSESKYLQTRVINTFRQYTVVKPPEPAAAIVRGAAQYGLKMDRVNSRVLTFTYGVSSTRPWTREDPIERKDDDGFLPIFSRLAERGTKAQVNKKFSSIYYPKLPDQTGIEFKVLRTPEFDAVYPDEPHLKFVGTLTIDLPDVHYGTDRPVEFSLTFGKLEIQAHAINKRTLQEYPATFYIDEL